MIISLFVILSVLCFASCENNVKPVTFSIFEVPLDSLPSELWFPELMAVDARSIISHSSRLCFIGPDDFNLVYFVDEKTGKELGYAGGVGEGPEDMQPHPQYVGKSLIGDTLFLFDFNERKMNAYLMSYTREELPKLKLVKKKSLVNTNVGGMNSSFINLCRLDNGFYVGVNFFNVTNYFFTLLDSNLNVVKQFGEEPLSGLPSDGKVKNYNSFEGSLYAWGNSIYYAANKFSYMARYDISDAGEITKKWDNQYATVDYHVKNQAIKFRGDNNLSGFSDIAVGEKYIFATYSGIPSGEMFKQRSVYAVAAQTLVVLNHDGAVLGRFKLKNRSFSVCLSENEKYLYVKNIDPEVQIERIKISDILKKIN